MINPSKTADAQGDCILFRLAAETRNQIYDLVYATETIKDGTAELNETTLPPCKDFLLTCQQVYDESRKVYEAAYRNYPTKFTINMPNRGSLPFTPALDNKLWRRMESLVVTWRADRLNKGQPIHFTSTFSFPQGSHDRCKAWVSMNERYWRGPQAAEKICSSYRDRGQSAMRVIYWSRSDPSWVIEGLGDKIAYAISFAVGARVTLHEDRIWS
jgi:hypothetical protein